MHAVVESGRLSESGLTTMLHRKLDWTDLRGVRWLLERGSDPNAVSAWGDRALHHSLARGNALSPIEALLDFGADPSLTAPCHHDRSAVALAGAGNTDAVALALDLGFPLAAHALPTAVWRERADTVRLLLARGVPVTADALALAERALTEASEWTPHRSTAILDMLRADAG